MTINQYKCQDCSAVFTSEKKKIDAVCSSCKSIHVSLIKQEEKTVSAEVMAPAHSGYYKALVAKKVEENSGLKEQRGWLLEQVYYLRKAVSFLETRKNVLEKAVESLEKNINAGIGAMEQLEENENFTQISSHVEKKNK